MDVLEKDIEDMIFNAAKSEIGQRILVERGLIVTGKMYRQVNLKGYGIADLVTVTPFHLKGGKVSSGREKGQNTYVLISVYELKRGPVNYAALAQAARYKTAIEELITKTHPNINAAVNIMLIGSEVDDALDFKYVLNLLPEVRVYTYRFGLTGLWFEAQGLTKGEKWTLPGQSPINISFTRTELKDMVRLSQHFKADYPTTTRP
jgi:hypothetical protein